MANLKEVQIDLASSVAGDGNEENNVSAEAASARSWFIPPLVVPILLAALLLSYVAYQNYF
jgi:hypothetical protein